MVLSSGGARGLAHIGVIEELEASGYIIDKVIGCSMGALVGGVYAAGGLKELKEWFLKMTLSRMFSLSDITFSTRYLMKGEKIIHSIEEMVPDCNIEDLPIPFRCVATDITHCEQMVFDHGSLFEAIRASMSLPIIFKPAEYEDALLIDGGILNALPINLAHAEAGSKLVAINLNTMKLPKAQAAAMPPRRPQNKFEELQFTLLKLIQTSPTNYNMADIVSKAFDVVINDNTYRTLRHYKPDILVNIPFEGLGDYDYDRAAELIEIGREAMHEAL